MKSFSDFYKEVYEPNAVNDKRFIDLHKVEIIPDPEDVPVVANTTKDQTKKPATKVEESHQQMHTSKHDELPVDKEKLAFLKKTFGDFRSGVGKMHKDAINRQAVKEGYDDIPELWSSNAQEVYEEIGKLISAHIDYNNDDTNESYDDTVASTSAYYMDWKGLTRQLEDLRDQLLGSLPVDAELEEAKKEKWQDHPLYKGLDNPKEVDKILDGAKPLSYNVYNTGGKDPVTGRDTRHPLNHGTHIKAHKTKDAADKHAEKLNKIKTKDGSTYHVKPDGFKFEETSLDEAFKPGKVKLSDGTEYDLSKDDAKHLGEMFKTASPASQTAMTARASKSKAEMESMIKFARNI
jgi:hypothetical protein